MDLESVNPSPPGAALAGAPHGADETDPVVAAIRAFQAGERREESFRLLFERFYRPVQRFFARRGFSPEDCLDLTQETFFGIYKGLDGYRGGSRFEAWLYRVAATTYLKRLRSQATAKRRGQEISPEALEEKGAELAVPGSQLDGVLDDERRAALREALRELPDQMRKCLMLRVEQGLKYREIAAVLRISIETVKAHLFQAKKRLKTNLLAGELGEER